MGKMQRDKGGRVERLLVNRLNLAGVPAERVPLSGAAGGEFEGDIRFKDGRIAEVKARKPKGVFWQLIKKYLGDHSYLILKEDRQDPLVVMPWEEFIRLQRRR